MDTTITITDEPKQRSWPKVVRKTGVVLFLLSFLTPPHWNFADSFYICGGFMAFVETPVWALVIAADGPQYGDWQRCLLGILIMVGWSANVTVLFRPPLPIALIAIASPWVLYAGMTFLGGTGGVDTTAITFIPFYPWSFGIALIHISKLAEPKPKEEPRTIWTGF